MKTNDLFKYSKWLSGLSIIFLLIGLPILYLSELLVSFNKLTATDETATDSLRLSVNRITIPGAKPLFIETTDSVYQQSSIIKFSRDGIKYSDSIVFKIERTLFSVLYYTDSDSIYFLTTPGITIMSCGEDIFNIELAVEDPFSNTYNMDDVNLWTINDSLWVDKFRPRLRPKAKVNTLYLRPTLYGANKTKDYQTLVMRMDSNFNLIVYP